MSSAPLPVPEHARPPLAWGRFVWGLALLAAGAAWLLDAAGVADVSYARVLAVALIGIGLVVPFVPAHEHGGVVGLGIVLTLLALVTVVAGPGADPTLLRHGVGDVRVAPVTAVQVHERYEHGIGDLVVDLHRVELPSGTTSTSVRLGAGQVRVRVPHGVQVHVDGRAAIGDVVVGSAKRSGVAPTFTGRLGTGPSTRVLDLDVAVGLGRIEVTP